MSKIRVDLTADEAEALYHPGAGKSGLFVVFTQSEGIIPLEITVTFCSLRQAEKFGRRIIFLAQGAIERLARETLAEAMPIPDHGDTDDRDQT